MNKIKEILISKFADRIINGEFNYHKAYKDAMIPPMNIEGKNLYTGNNRIMLCGEFNGYKTPLYMTAIQAKNNDMTIKKGEHAHSVLFVKKYIEGKKDQEQEAESFDDEENKNVHVLTRYYNVFSIDQLEGKYIDKYLSMYQNMIDKIIDFKKESTDKYIIDGLKEYLKSNNIELIETNETWTPKMQYKRDQTSGKIIMPLEKQFYSDAEYVSVFIHELSHYYDEIKLKTKSNREDKEIIAETSALFTMINISSSMNHNVNIYNRVIESSFDYIKGWSKAKYETGKENEFKNALGRAFDISGMIMKDVSQYIGIDDIREKERFKKLLEETQNRERTNTHTF